MTMKHIFLYGVWALTAIACSNAVQYNEQDLIGSWVEPIPGQTGVQGVTLQEGGKAQSIHMATLRYEGWKCEGDRLILTGTSIGNKVSTDFADTLHIVKLTQDSLLLSRDRLRINYSRMAEGSDALTDSVEVKQGTIIFGHEVRAFQPDNDSLTYWLVDRSGTLQEKYRKSGEPEWTVRAKLEIKDLGKSDDGFAEDYDSTYEVVRILELED